MNKPAQALFALAALGLSSLFVSAQPAPKILVVDMAKLFDNHYKTAEQNAKLSGEEQKANVELEKLNKEGTDLVNDYKELGEQAKNPALTAEARAKADADVQKKYGDIQNKRTEIDNFRATVQRSMQQRIKNFRDLMLEEIGKTATDIAKKKGATLLLDKTGLSILGVATIVYSDPAYDITDEVMLEINKDRPTTPLGTVDVGTPAAAPAAAPAMGSPPPTITVPDMPAKK